MTLSDLFPVCGADFIGAVGELPKVRMRLTATKIKFMREFLNFLDR